MESVLFCLLGVCGSLFLFGVASVLLFFIIMLFCSFYGVVTRKENWATKEMDIYIEDNE